MRNLLFFLITNPTSFCIAYFIKNVCPVRRPLRYALIVTALLDLAWLTDQLLKPQPPRLTVMLCYPLILLVLLAYVRPGQRVRALLAQELLGIVPMVTAGIKGYGLLMPLTAGLGLELADFTELNGKYYLLTSLIVNTASCLLIWAVSRMLKRLLTPMGGGGSMVWVLPVPFSQIALMLLLSNLMDEIIGFRKASLFALLGIALCAVSDWACVLGYRKYRKMQQANLLLKEATQQLDLQAEHYRSLRQDILAVNQLRHDLKNQLQAACYLLEQGHTREVRQQLDLLDDQLNRRVGSRFCENLMVDAVLAGKAALCREKGIRLELSALVPQEISVENGILCSAFSNLLDNSIQATLRSPHPEGPITLDTDLRGEFLVVRCTNPAAAPVNRKNTDLLREHGLGLEILTQIARAGEGDFRTEYAEGSFRAVLILKK